MSEAAAPICAQWFTLAADWTIAACGDGVPAAIALAAGMVIWEAFPGSEEHFRPVYEAGFRTGVSSGLVYWNDDITEIHTVKRGDHLLVSFTYVTVAGLRATLEQIAAEVDRRDSRRTISTPSPKSSRHLRVVQP